MRCLLGVHSVLWSVGGVLSQPERVRAEDEVRLRLLLQDKVCCAYKVPIVLLPVSALDIHCLTMYSHRIMQSSRTRACRFSFRFPAETGDLLREISRRTGRDLTEVIELLILQEARKKTIKRAERSR